MADKKWRFREDIVFQYINGSSNNTFQNAEDRLNYLEAKEQLPDMREKVREYISELDVEIDRCIKENEKILENTNISHGAMIISQFKLAEKIETLTKVKNDLQSRLDELI